MQILKICVNFMERLFPIIKYATPFSRKGLDKYKPVRHANHSS